MDQERDFLSSYLTLNTSYSIFNFQWQFLKVILNFIIVLKANCAWTHMTTQLGRLVNLAFDFWES